MKKKYLLLALIILSSISNAVAQNHYDIVFPRSAQERDLNCQQCTNAFRYKPKEVRFRINNEGNRLYFQITDKDWFSQIFRDSGDGIAVDIVAKDQYGCDKAAFEIAQIKGVVLKPVYSSELRKGLKPYQDNSFRVYVGEIPKHLIGKELEYNIMFLDNKNMCRYNRIYNLESYSWDLLDMGMYLDSLTYDTKRINPKSKEGFVLRNKTLKFKIPFKKDISVYSYDDIKPIYDSLQLTDFNIKSIKIKAYSSVEGSLERNIELQEQRANSIVAALQSFQKPTIKTEVSSSENWVEFLNDIKGTKYENLNQLTKKAIKAKLVGSYSVALEPILQHHRKAVLELELEKKDKYKTMPANELLEKFNTAIVSNHLEEAVVMQNSIFEKIKGNIIPPEFLKKMEVPIQNKFVNILNKNSAFKYMLDRRQAVIVYNELLALEKLEPNNAKVKYNIAAISLTLWRFKWKVFNEVKLKNQINALRNYGIHKNLILRMMVNYHIVKAENSMRARDFVNKDKSVSYIINNYKAFTLSDYDYLSLAQFLSYYANIDKSVELLENKARRIDVDEDLLYFYLNLTLVRDKLTQDPNYRTTLLNAFNMNNERFCKLFNSVENGGVTFQLLVNNYLRSAYCESCNN